MLRDSSSSTQQRSLVLRSVWIFILGYRVLQVLLNSILLSEQF